MSISYSALNNYGRITLPSVDTWGTNMNILKDPPKSIHTRKIDKVGQTSDITTMIDDAGDRACEAIRQYSLGVNPMVSVSYNNYGNNGGQRSGGLQSNGGRQAFMPYTVGNDGAFRPPVIRQEDILPLSRMPRVWTTAMTKPGFADFSKKIRTCGTAADTKEVKTSTLKTFVRPTAVYKIDKPMSEPFEIKYVIQPAIHNSATSGIRTMDLTQQEVKKPTKEVSKDPLYASAKANLSQNKHVNNSDFNADPYTHDEVAHAFAQSNKHESKHVHNVNMLTDPYTQDIPHAYALSNKRDIRETNKSDKNTDYYIQDTNLIKAHTNVGSKNIQVTSIEDVVDMSEVHVKDAINVTCTAPSSGHEKTDFIHEDIVLNRILPEHEARTNITSNMRKNLQHDKEHVLERNTPLTQVSVNPRIHKNTDAPTREFRLASKIQPGGYNIPAGIPQLQRNQDMMPSLSSDKSRMVRAVNRQYDRYNRR